MVLVRLRGLILCRALRLRHVGCHLASGSRAFVSLRLASHQPNFAFTWPHCPLRVASAANPQSSTSRRGQTALSRCALRGSLW